MADKKISQLPKINLISGSEVILPIVHDGTTQKMDVSTFAVFASQWSADTGSNTFIGNQIISGNLTLTGNSVIGGNSVIAGNVEVGGMITAQQYNVTYVSSSVQYKSGSTEFGDSTDDTHTITGTIILNGLALGTPELMAQTASQAVVNLGISSVTGSINTTTSSFNSVFQRISSTTGSINTTTSSFNSVFLGVSSVTGALNTFTQSFNSISGSYATTGSNTFRGNQSITGSLSVSAGEFNVTTGSGNMTSSLIFDHTQNDGVTLGLRHNDRLFFADHTFNTQVWAAGVYTTFVRNGTPYSILNVEAFDDNKIYLYRDTRLYNKSLVIDNNLTVQNSLLVNGVITGSLLSTNGVVSSSNQLFELNQQTGSQSNLNAQIGISTASLNFTTGALNLFTGSVIGQTNTIAAFTSSVNFTTQSLNTQTGSQDLVNRGISSVTGSINTTTSSFNLVFIGISSVTGAINTQSSSQDLVNYQNSIVTSSFRNEIGGIEAYTASLKSAIVVNGNNVRIIGELTASRIYTEFITSSVLFVTGSNIIGDQSSDKHEFTGSVNINDTLFIKGQAIGTGQLNAFTGSQIGKDFTLSIVTSSIDAHILKQAIQTGSQDLVNLAISTYTGSQNVINTSIDSHILKQAIQTGSQDLVNLGISTATGSLVGITNSLMALTASMKGQAIVSSSNQIPELFRLMQATASLNTYTGSNDSVVASILQTTASLNTLTGSMGAVVNSVMAYTSSLKSAFTVSGTTTTHSGPVDLGGYSVYSNWGTPANINNAATTTFTHNQTSGEYQVQFQYNILGLYAPSGTNLSGYASGIVHFMADGATNNAAVSSIGANGWTVTASATNGGAFTITFTNSSGATMTNVNYRITKLNRTGGG